MKPHRRTTRRLIAAATLLPTLGIASSSRAIITYGSGDPTHNTTAPSGTLANSGWQWQGQWAGSFLGTAIAPQYFISAAHLGGSLGGTFVSSTGVSYQTIAFPDGSTNKHIAGTDLVVWRVNGTFNSYAPLWDPTIDGSETGQTAVMFGRGTQRGAEIRLPQSTGTLRGWQWGASDDVQRWGTNIVTAVQSVNVSGTVAPGLVLNFDANPVDRLPSLADATGYSGPDEAILSDHDSGGGIFIKSGSTWKLAGINWSVVSGFSYAANGTSIGTGQALFDYGGFYQTGSASLLGDTLQDKPAYSVASAISQQISGIAATLAGSPAVWNVDAGGTWATQANWWTDYTNATPLPNGSGARAIFGRVITAPRTVTLASSKTVGTLSFDSPQSYTLSGSQLVMDNTAVGTAAINVTAGAHTIAAPLQLNNNTTVTVTPDPANSSRLTVTGALTTSPGVTLTKAGAGPMDVTVLHLPAVTVTAGTLRVLPNGTTAATSKLSALSVTGGKLDLANNDLVIDYTGTTPADTIRQYLLSGRNAGAWTGTGVVSSTAAADPQQRTAIAAVEASDLLGLAGAATTSWSGQTVDATSVLLKYTWYGDANLDGKITADDYALLDRGQARGLTGWLNGDFNYDNLINAADYALIDRAFGTQFGTLSPEFLSERQAQFGEQYVSSLLATLPEPALPLFSILYPLSSRVLRRRRAV